MAAEMASAALSQPDAALENIIQQVQAARAAKAPLEIRGSASKAFYGGQPRGDVLDMRPLAGISSHEPTELVVTARAGTPLPELEAALAEHGQHLPFEPPQFAGEHGVGTVGGMVAAGLSGPARATAGALRDHVLGVTLLNGRGELLSFGGQVMKNVAGYDVSRLLAGSLGVLGVICEVSLKVLPRPPAVATLRFELDAERALCQINQWAGRPLPLSASAWWEGMLVLRLAGAQAAVAQAMQQLGGEVVGQEMAEPFWQGLRDHSDEFFASAHKAVVAGATLWRLSVPATTPPMKLPGEQLIEWGGAQRWVCTTAPAATLREAAAHVGGHAVVFRSLNRSEGHFAPLPPALAQIHRRLKDAFDPDRVFNPGRLLPDL
jgi:glycolate oxidase FAD binding subunit